MLEDPVTAAEPERESVYPSSAYAWYCVFILMGIYLNSFLDRQILGLLVDPIKADMGISDTQMGFLMGPSFAIFYIIAGLPLGWLADRMSRRLLIAIGQFFWSIASVGFGMGRSYTQLIAARVGVGVGEATLSPSAYSLIADLFPPKRLALALSVYGMGIYNRQRARQSGRWLRARFHRSGPVLRPSDRGRAQVVADRLLPDRGAHHSADRAATHDARAGAQGSRNDQGREWRSASRHRAHVGLR